MSPFVLCATAALLFTAASVEGVYGPETPFTAADFRQVAAVLYFNDPSELTLGAFILSARFVITDSYLYPGEESKTKVYTGDLSSRANANSHKIMKIITLSGSRFSIARICPPISNYQPISLIESQNFNYQTNTTGKIFYWRPDLNGMFYRTADVLTDAACANDNAAAPVRATYAPPSQTCIKFDPANGSCKHRCNDGNYDKCNAVLLTDAYTGAIVAGNGGTCTADGAGSRKTTSIAVFHKAMYFKSDIVSSATVDLA